MFETFIVQPLFNLLALIYALLPGHNFGVAIILFTIVIRMLMWPLLKRQLHHAKAIRALQPELKKIKKAAKGDRQKESMLVMELYKERQVSPFGSLGLIFIQFVVLIGLYSGLQKVVKDPQAIIDFAYPPIAQLPWLQELSTNIALFDATFLGFIDLSRPALGPAGLYIPGLVLVIGSAAAQFMQSSQLMPRDEDARSLRTILKEASSGKQAEQAEINAAIGRSTRYIIPVAILFFTLGVASALNLYWFVGGIIAYIQQSKVLKQDETELEAVADEEIVEKKTVIEGELVEKKTPKRTNKKKKTTKTSQNKRRKR